MPPRKRELTRKQKLFVDEYLVDSNATQSAIRAGYKAKNAHVVAYELLNKTLIKDALAVENAKRSIRTQISQDWLLEKSKIILDRSMQAEEVTDASGQGIGEYRFAGGVATKNLEFMARMQGYLSDKLQVTGPEGGAVKIDHQHNLKDMSDEALKAMAESLINGAAAG